MLSRPIIAARRWGETVERSNVDGVGRNIVATCCNLDSWSGGRPGPVRSNAVVDPATRLPLAATVLRPDDLRDRRNPGSQRPSPSGNAPRLRRPGAVSQVPYPIDRGTDRPVGHLGPPALHRPARRHGSRARVVGILARADAGLRFSADLRSQDRPVQPPRSPAGLVDVRGLVRCRDDLFRWPGLPTARNLPPGRRTTDSCGGNKRFPASCFVAAG